MATDSDYDKFIIHRGTHWDVYISDRGGDHLGRLYFWLKRNGIVYLSDLQYGELHELIELENKFRKALTQAFKPDLFNFAHLANEAAHGHHCHWHLVPRYKDTREFHGTTFTDHSWGKQWVSAKLRPDLAILIGQRALQARLNL